MESVIETQNIAKHDDIIAELRSGRTPTHDGRLDLRGAKLAGMDLSGLKLTNADLTDADLSGADLHDAHLSGADLSAAQLFGADLTGAHLAHAILRNANLTGADLTDADLSGIQATQAGFGLATLHRAQLQGAVLDGASLSQADLTEACLNNADLSGSRLREAILTNADFTAADLRDAHLSLSDVTGASFRNSDLRNARVRMLRGYKKADWIGADIRDVGFAGGMLLRRFIMDQNYIMEFRHSGRTAGFLYYPWMITSDCGRSLARWCGMILTLVILFGLLYQGVGVDYGVHETWFSPYYFSIVTITTLGYGDVLPATLGSQWIAVSEVVVGYMMLGGLLSIFSNKIARRAD